MHPLLLFTLLFIPGIKSSYEVRQETISLKGNSGELAVISNTDVAPIEEPRTVDSINLVKTEEHHAKPYENHLADKFNKFNKHGLEYKNNHEFLSSKGEVNHHDLVTPIHQDPIIHKPEHSPRNFENNKKNKEKYKKVRKYLNKMHYNKFGKFNEKADDSETLKKHKEGKENKHRERIGKLLEQRKRFNKALKKEIVAMRKRNRNVDFPLGKEYNKRNKEYFKKNLKNEKERRRAERTKRQADTSESEEEDYHIDEEQDSDENKSDVSLASVEKRFMAHFLEEVAAKDDYHPFEDTIEVKLKQNSGENDERIPVVEEEFTKKLAYVSCGRGGGPGCGKDAQTVHQNVAADVIESKKTDDDNQEDNIDMAAWLRAFEDDIFTYGKDVKYNHN